MRYCETEFRCPHDGCDSRVFYCEQQLYDGTHEQEDYEYSWANVAPHERYGIAVYEPDGTCKPFGYRYPPNRWTTKKARDADPDLARRVEETQVTPLLSVTDYTWFKCDKCEKEIDSDWAYSLVPKFKKNADGSFNLVLYEEIGMVIINPYSVARVDFGCSDELDKQGATNDN